MLKHFFTVLRVYVFFVPCFLFAQFNIPPVPAEQKSVYDQADVLSDAEESLLRSKLENYADTTGTQIVIVTEATIKGENIGLLAPRWGQEWGVGQAEDDNGVFILLAESERQIWISPGYGAESYLTAGIVGEIIRNIITPEFKKGDYYTGLDLGTTALIQALNGQFKAPERSPEKIPYGFLFLVVLMIIIVFFVVVYKRSKGGGGNNSGTGRFSGPDLMDIIILSRMGRSGGGSFGGGFGSSGGGFGGGFGGGGFSGGGAGGSW